MIGEEDDDDDDDLDTVGRSASRRSMLNFVCV